MTQATVAAAGAPGGARRRGGGSGAPATDPRTITDFEDVAAIPFVFARHPVRQQGAERAITLTRWACPCLMGG